MSLPPAAIQQFRLHGFCAVPGFLSLRETAALRAEVARFQRLGLLRNVSTDGDGRTPSARQANLQLIPLHDKSELIRALPFEPKVTQAVETLIGSPFVLHLDQLFLKPGRHGSGTDWHQDNAYFRIADPMMGTAMWIAVHEASVANGTLHVIPGSHTEAYPHTRDPYSDHHIHCQPPAERAVPVELPAGGAVFFSYGTAHCTRANTTDRERAGMAFHFLRIECLGQARLAEASRRLPVLIGPQATGGLREYGVHVGGTWEHEVERVLAEADALREPT